MSTPQAPYTTFLIMSDTHNFEVADNDKCPLSACRSLTNIDVLLHCGDLTQVGGISAYKKALRLLGELDAELKLVIGGDHDLSLDGEYWKSDLDEEAGDEPEEHERAIDIMTGPLAKAANVTYLSEGLHTFRLKSGVAFTIYASPYQPRFGDWAFGYDRSEDKFTDIPDNVDIVMTHGPPRGVLDRVKSRERPGEDEHLGCDALLRAIDRTKPLLHCFGHIHDGYGAQSKQWEDQKANATASKGGDRGHIIRVMQAGLGSAHEASQDSLTTNSTLMVNAAIMNGQNAPENDPWLVTIGLPRR
ncbi:hypothetical protein AAFC00_005195 [Neodothiora populina]|uniref:Calcineurin-like phosphoesterase domain-containing protein n=1 Tax=Neodothiora populina TaxID=2781224 RepID=A0ABR3PKA6_9PEZI